MTFNSGSWVVLNGIERIIKNKIENLGKPLKEWKVQINYGIKTGFNEAFIIDTEKRNEIIKKCPEADDIIRPILRGRDISRYNYKLSDSWIILVGYGDYKTLEKDYPSIYEYLLQYEEKLKNRGQCRYTSSGKTNPLKEYPGQHHWLELDNNPSHEYLNFFKQPKIVWGEISDKSKFAYDTNQIYTEATTFLMTGEKLKFLLAMLNSYLLEWYFNQIGTATGVGTNRWKKYTIEMLPIKVPTENEIKSLENYVDTIIKNDPSEVGIQDSINKLIYKLYDLSDLEVSYIESMNKASSEVKL